MSQEINEIMGQKLAYPSTWQGAATVFSICVAFVLIAYIFKAWATPDNINALKGLYAGTAVQDKLNEELVKKVQSLTERIALLENNGKTQLDAKNATLEEFKNINTLLNLKTTIQNQSTPNTFKATEITKEELDNLLNKYQFKKDIIEQLQNNK